MTVLNCKSQKRECPEDRSGQQCHLLLRKLKTEACPQNSACWRTLVTLADPVPAAMRGTTLVPELPALGMYFCSQPPHFAENCHPSAA